jgi:hypothetical protein
MEGWQQDWVKMLETVADEIERFFEGVAKDLNEAADAWVNFSEEVAEQMERTIAPAIDQMDDQIDAWIEPILLAFTSFEAAVGEAAAPVTHTVEPILNQHPVCVGCRHYHGQSYNGNMLVCAMHPYGVEEGVDSCPDKEAFSWGLPRTHAADVDENC